MIAAEEVRGTKNHAGEGVVFCFVPAERTE